MTYNEMPDMSTSALPNYITAPHHNIDTPSRILNDIQKTQEQMDSMLPEFQKKKIVSNDTVSHKAYASNQGGAGPSYSDPPDETRKHGNVKVKEFSLGDMNPPSKYEVEKDEKKDSPSATPQPPKKKRKSKFLVM